MKRKITTILLTMLLVALTAIGLCACDKECKHEYGEWAAVEKIEDCDSWTNTLASGKYTLICSDMVTE